MSGLDQINADNVHQLAVAWTFFLGVLRGQEAAPMVAEDTMFVVTAYPNILYALDLTKPGAPLRWKHEPKPLAAAQGVACCDTVNRGAAYADGRVFFNTLDGQTIALDAEPGEEHWRARLGDIDIGETITMAPLVVRGKVLVGNSGGEYGVRGWIVALDADDGNLVWRAYSTGPDAEVLIGERFQRTGCSGKPPALDEAIERGHRYDKQAARPRQPSVTLPVQCPSVQTG